MIVQVSPSLSLSLLGFGGDVVSLLGGGSVFRPRIHPCVSSPESFHEKEEDLKKIKTSTILQIKKGIRVVPPVPTYGSTHTPHQCIMLE